MQSPPSTSRWKKEAESSKSSSRGTTPTEGCSIEDCVSSEDYPDSSVSAEQNAIRQKFECEWQQLSLGIGEVRRRALTGALRTSRMRSFAWAMLLDVLPSDPDMWMQAVTVNRNEYETLKGKYIYDPRIVQHITDNPLSQTEESKWNQYFIDKELLAVIKLDVVRTFPGVEIFKQSFIRNAMMNILFIYAKENPSLLYRQGMHEILAPILFILFSDHQAAQHVPVGSNLGEIMNPDFIEHDGYAIFKAMMKGIEKFYSIQETTSLLINPFMPRSRHINVVAAEKKLVENEITRYLRLLNEQILYRYDPELARHLEKCDISMTLFGVRWLRVLFGREFPLQDVLVLWDVILAEGKDFSLAGYILVAMLIVIRTPLLNNDLNSCLTVLLNYPTSIDVQYIIDNALYLKNPDLYCRPTVRSFSLTNFNRRNVEANTSIRSSIHAKSKRHSKSRLKVATTAEESVVVDGDLLNDSMLLREELAHAHHLMANCSSKLSRYEDVLRKKISKTVPPSDPVYQTLNNIRELCAILKPECNPTDVEPALEANDFQYVHKKIPKNEELPVTESFVSYGILVKEIPLKLIGMKTQLSDNSALPCINPFQMQLDS